MGFLSTKSVITKIEKNSIAEKLGIKVDDIIVSLDGKDIIYDNDWSRIRNTSKNGNELIIQREYFYHKYFIPSDKLGMRSELKNKFIFKANSSKIRSLNRTALNNLSSGLSIDEVKNLFGFGEVKTSDKGIITNPYRTGTIKDKSGNEFTILFYYTDNKGKNIKNVINDQDLTPLVFQDDKLIGWGWTFIEDDLNKFELRLR